MAQFYAEIQGNKGATSRLGSKSSGMSFDVNAWDVGVDGYGFTDGNDNDVFVVRSSGGSNNVSHPQGLMTVTEEYVEFRSGYCTVKVYKDGRIFTEWGNGS